jgi:hypothetical protein
MSEQQQIALDRKARMDAASVVDAAAWQEVLDGHAAKVASTVLDGEAVTKGEIGKDSPSER